jgi:membrane protein DedA with SNARE-associated domain
VDELLPILIFKGHLLFFLWILANRLGVPLPATPALLAAGALVGLGEWQIAPILALAVAATLLSDTVWFLLGRYFGRRVLQILCRVTLEPDALIRRAEGFFTRHGARSLLFSKFVPGMNRPVLPLIGTARIGLFKFLTFDFFGALFWTTAYAGIGYLFSDALEEAIRAAAQLGWYAAMFFVLILAGSYAGWKHLNRRQRCKEEAPPDAAVPVEAGSQFPVGDQ